ncbi:hypothetical protein A3C87_02220 [Candidatus Kaiserbacteria bacterium RIFCSPHIGHO2_02_FULL_49_34]|uniref:CNNM transmembrane domain-containing protein n=1 Tax=Candidatus Kaiserbacteria bacterium RIFCSPHIGHO2_02_FULL_49_34 TaxID=1798491 RepID=A0A1F6DL09_9BACT|nr:MAG: hypothetical protein A3C87_02220 [Candidatus Kaiserbacteria bacterium RIFCSPHIGHO2_02_FULL_49_34]
MEIYIYSLLLILCSALFSGLTLGYFSLDVFDLKRQAALGNKDAARVYPLRVQGNLLLTTLLLGNVIVNTTLAVFLAQIASGVVAATLSIVLIFIFGELVPQATLARHGLKFGSLSAPLMRVLIFIGYPVTWPVARVLDKMLGNETQTMYSKHELMHLISEHEDSEHSPIDRDEERIMHGALTFSHKEVWEAMTPWRKVVRFSADTLLDDAFREIMIEHNYSRYPIFKDDEERIIGTLYASDVVIEDEAVSIEKAENAFERKVYRARASEKLDTILARMLKTRHHQYVVFGEKDQPVGVITLEDIIEEIIQQEIEDEGDVEAGA